MTARPAHRASVRGASVAIVILFVFGVVGLVVLVGGCGAPDSGILLEVTATDLMPDRLQFVIGSQLGGSQDATFVQDPLSSFDASVAGRNLATDPYRLLVHDGLDTGVPMSGAVIARSGTNVIGFAGLSSVAFVPDKVLVYRLALDPTGTVRTTDTGCVSWTADGVTTTIAGADDHDCDGYLAASAGGDDCNDENASINPGVVEVCANNVDDNCNGAIDESPDDDGDGYHLCAGDCDDRDPDVHPGATEICDGKDNDCNGLCDDGFDADGDGYTTCGTHIEAGGGCTAAPLPDCNDNDPAIHPDATEICDGKDNDCNGVCDDGAVDKDGDGFTACGTLAGLAAPADGICGAKTPLLVDCRDVATTTTSKTVHPFAHEICDGIVDRCGGPGEASEPCYKTLTQGPNTCVIGTRTCDDVSDGSFGLRDDCTADLPTFAVDTALCVAYDDSGLCRPDSEPWRCASEAAAKAILDCTLSYQLDLGTATTPPAATLCPASVVALPALGTTNCIYDLIGGMAQEGYDAGLRKQGTTTAPLASYLGCDAELAVTAATNDFAPQPDEWVLMLHDATSLAPPGAIVVKVTPTRAAACPAMPIACTMIVK